MQLLIDANIILDVLQKRDPYCMDSAKIWKLCETEQVQGYISALSFANLVYVMRKELTPDLIEDVLMKLSLIFTVSDLRECDLKDAAKLKWDDFEDAVQAVIASRINADYIITRNVKDYSKCKIPAFTPSEFLDRLPE